MSTTLSEELKWRGLIKDKTFADNSWLDNSQTFYLGIDASSDSLTVGNLAIILLARRLASNGWHAYMLMGGGTSLVGDPGGKNQERILMSREQVVSNIKGIEAQVKSLFSEQKFTIVDNYDWLSKLKYVDFLREVGKHFSMTELMQRDFVAERMGKDGMGISYAEFSYSLMQGFDFWQLHNNHGVVLQIGGSDQWGNLISGVSLIRKKETKEVHALSMPLIINKTTGAKFGKSEEGAVWLDEKKTSAFKFYQFWLNVDDESVEEYLKTYTLLKKQEIIELLDKFKLNPGDRLAQKTLAYEVSKLVHGEIRAKAVQEISEVLFGKGSFLELDEAQKQVLTTELPVVPARDDTYEVVCSAGLAGSKGEARNFHSAGSLTLNGQRVLPEQSIHFQKGLNLLKRGKNSFAIVDNN